MARDIGLFIKQLRKEQGLTQKELADILYVTDKAVSKWERGLSFPDSSLLFKIASFFNCDVDDLVETNLGNNRWTGILYLDDYSKCDCYSFNGRPILELMLGYFLLAGIKDIEIRASNCGYIDSFNFERYGLNIVSTVQKHKRVLIIKSSYFLFGTSLTKLFLNCMSSGFDTILSYNDRDTPFVFAHNGEPTSDENCSRKAIWRGMLGIPLNSAENVFSANMFANLFKSFSGRGVMVIEDIYEARKRN